jgi:glycerophosphoryl diester phosphodiesterase
MTDRRDHSADGDTNTSVSRTANQARRAPLRLPRQVRPLAAWLLVVLLASWYIAWINWPAGITPMATSESGPWIIAHRGSALHAPENTLAAIRWSLTQDVDAIEVDVHLAADGIPVLMHDTTVDRTTDGTGNVSDYTAAELAALDAGGWFDAAFAGEPVPTLAQVLDVVAGQVVLSIEIKGGEEYQQGITAAVIDEVAARQADSWCWIGSFHDSVLERAAALRADQAPAMRLVKIAVGQVTGLPLAVDDGPRLGWIPFGQSVAAVAMNHRLLTGAEADRLHRQNLQVWAWTANDADAIARALHRGADAVITDTPPLAREVIATHAAGTAR